MTRARGWNATIALVFLMAILSLAIWAQEAGFFLRGDLDSGGGTTSTATTTVTGSLGSWFSTVPIQSADGALRVVPGLLNPPLPAGVTGDIDGDADVDFGDFLLFAQAFGTNTSDPSYNQKADFDSNGTVDFGDFLIFAGAFGT